MKENESSFQNKIVRIGDIHKMIAENIEKPEQNFKDFPQAIKEEEICMEENANVKKLNITNKPLFPNFKIKCS